MEELAMWLMGAVAVMVAVFFAVWIAVALLVRVFSIVLAYWIATFLAATIAGLVAGVVLPLRVLTGRGRAPLVQILPSDLVAGTIIRTKPLSPNREHGWDNAWPSYMPYQAREDASAVRSEVRLHLRSLWQWVASKTSSGSRAAGGGKISRGLSGTGRALPRLAWYATTLPAYVGYYLGTWSSTLVWFLIMGTIGTLITVVQKTVVTGHKFLDIFSRRRRDASLKCPHPGCYAESILPGFRCANPECGVIHWTMLPGPLGLLTRRCSCGSQLPNSVRAATKRLKPVCPVCRRDLAAGSGSRQTVQIAVMGTVGAGKSRLLDALVVELSQVVRGLGGAFTPLDARATAFLARAEARMRDGSLNPKTQHGEPVGLPFTVEHAGALVEMQVMDVAGESFTSWEETSRLRYLDNARAIVMVVDPLALPGTHDAFVRSPFAGRVVLASGDQEEAYGAAIDRMRAESVPVGRRSLAVVLTKGDVLRQLPGTDAVSSADSPAVRQWLIDTGSDLMVRRFEKDFREVWYFLVDSMQDRDAQDRLNPWWVAEWLLRESRSHLRLSEALTRASAAPAAVPTSDVPVPVND